jgi:hypothetical protein
MLTMLRILLATTISSLRTREELAIENLGLRQLLADPEEGVAKTQVDCNRTLLLGPPVSGLARV